MRLEHHPGIPFRDGASGRRAIVVGGPDVWEVVRLGATKKRAFSTGTVSAKAFVSAFLPPFPRLLRHTRYSEGVGGIAGILYSLPFQCGGPGLVSPPEFGEAGQPNTNRQPKLKGTFFTVTSLKRWLLSISTASGGVKSISTSPASLENSRVSPGCGLIGFGLGTTSFPFTKRRLIE